MSKMKPIILVIVLTLGLWGADEAIKIRENMDNENVDVSEKQDIEENKNVSEEQYVEESENISEKQEPIENKQEETIEVEESKVIEVTDETFEKEVLKSEKLVLIDFYATWCRPCQILSPRIEEVAKENEHIKVVRIDVDIATNTASIYEINSFPTLVIMKNGEVKSGVSGVVSKEYINQMIISALNAE